MKMTKQDLKQMIKHSIQEARGFRNVTPEPSLVGLTAVDPKMSTQKAMTRGEKSMIAMDSESENKNYVIRLSDGKGDFSTVYFGNLETAANDFNEAGHRGAKNKEIAVFSVKSDRQVGSLTTDDQGRAVGFTHVGEKGKKYKPEDAGDLDDLDDLDETVMESKKMKVTQQYLKQVIKEELDLMVENGEIDEGLLDRLGARVKSGLQGLGGAASSALAGAKGAAASGVRGVAQKAAGALGAKTAAKEIGAAKKAGEKATSQQQQQIAAKTQAKQTAIKFSAAISPKVQEIENDMAALLPNAPKTPEFDKAAQALDALKQAVAAVNALAGK